MEVINDEKIDLEIQKYLGKINAYKFVRTEFSCQGHYLKHMTRSIVSYHKIIKDRTGIVAFSPNSRTKYPYVLLQFADSRVRKLFLRALRKTRGFLLKNSACYLSLINARNNRNFHKRIFKPCLYAVNLEERYLTLTLVLNHGKFSLYERERLSRNKLVKYYREVLFDLILEMLVVIGEKIIVEE